jgi:quercetin dioxygenase-like cupin family protein
MKTVDANIACVVHESQPYQSQQGSIYTAAISAETVGAKSLFFGIVTIPPGERTKAHIHQFHESAFYVLSGENIELWSGSELEHREVACAGDYLFIPWHDGGGLRRSAQRADRSGKCRNAAGARSACAVKRTPRLNLRWYRRATT